MKTQVLVIGSGAGGATTACELASAGLDVLLVEEGNRHPLDRYGLNSAEAMRHLYRRRGMTPILGPIAIGYVEGRCLGGSTEINSAFWHRTPDPVLAHWQRRFGLAEASTAELAPHFDALEQSLSVSRFGGEWPSMTTLFADGARSMQLVAPEIPRVVRNCSCETPCSSGCRTGGKQSMSRSLVPRAEAAGARVVTGCRVTRIKHRGSRAIEALATIADPDGRGERTTIAAEHIFICGGPTQTPWLLRQSGIHDQVGRTLQVHPMLKVAARFGGPTGASTQPIPLLQIDLGDGISIGGAHCSAGHLAMHMSENWGVLASRMADANRMAVFHVAVKGDGHGWVAPSVLGTGMHLRYVVSQNDHRRLREAAAVLITLLLRSGADEVYPAIHGLPIVKHESELQGLTSEKAASVALSLTTVHAFSTCPIGEHRRLTAADSFGKVWGFENLFINDASILPDSPGVNPQGSIMALARRNALRFLESLA